MHCLHKSTGISKEGGAEKRRCMKKKLAKATALSLAAAMSVTGIPIICPVSVKASAAEKTDDSVICRLW